MQGGSGGRSMKRAVICSLLLSLIFACSIHAQSKLSVKWEELTAADFRDAIQLSKGTCLLPFGILEKHGPHLPLGTDLLNVRHASLQAAQQEYAVVFRSEEHTSELQSPCNLVCRLLLEKKKKIV